METLPPRLPSEATPQKVIRQLFPTARPSPAEPIPEAAARFFSLDEAIDASPASPPAASVLRELAKNCPPGEYIGNAQRVLKAMGEPDSRRVMRYLQAVEPLRLAAKVIATGPRGGKIVGHRSDGSPIYARGTRKRAKHIAEHNALRAAAAAHAKAPSPETAAALTDAHDALLKKTGHTAKAKKPTVKAEAAKPWPDAKPRDAADRDVRGGTAPRPTPVDVDPLAPGEGASPGEPAAGEPVSPQTPMGDSRAKAAAMQAQVADLHEKLQGVEHAISGELVPMFNALKADMRRLYKRPQQGPIGFLGQRVEAFVEMVTKVLKAGVSLATQMAKSSRLPQYMARAKHAKSERDDQPLAKAFRVIGYDPALEALAFDLLEDVVVGLPAWLATEAKVERLAQIREGMAKSCRYQPTASPLHRGEVALPGGLVAMIEVPAGEHREGVGADGQAWSAMMPVHYGELEGTLGRDGDPIDVFLGPHAATAGPVWISDVYDGQGRRAEDKAFIGFGDEDDVLTVIDFVYQPVRSRVMDPRQMSWDDFCAWAGRRPAPLGKSSPLAEVERDLDAVLSPTKDADALVASLVAALAELEQ